MEDLPDGVASHWKSPEFSETSVPDNLLKSHRTKADTYAKIVILEGSLRYRVLESGAELWKNPTVRGLGVAVSPIRKASKYSITCRQML